MSVRWRRRCAGAALRRGSARACRSGSRTCGYASARLDGASARVIIAEGSGAGGALSGCRAGQIVTCGLARCDTVTPSSTLGGGLAALQRELTTLSGGVAEPRELDLSALSGAIEQKMMLAAALLLLDAF